MGTVENDNLCGGVGVVGIAGFISLSPMFGSWRRVVDGCIVVVAIAVVVVVVVVAVVIVVVLVVVVVAGVGVGIGDGARVGVVGGVGVSVDIVVVRHRLHKVSCTFPVEFVV